MLDDETAPWRIGIENRADPSTGRASGDLWSASVQGPSLLWVDVSATAAVVKGPDARDWIESLDGYEGLVVARDGRAVTTSDLGVRPEPAG